MDDALRHVLHVIIATIPSPPFQNVELGLLTVHGYGLVVGLAMVAAMSVAEWALERQDVSVERFTPLAALLALSAIVGARGFFLASHPAHFLEQPNEILLVWRGGLNIYGGLAGSMIVAVLSARRWGIPLPALADAAAPGILAAVAVARWGNYLNQELFGRPFDGPWALRVDAEHRPAADAGHDTFHPLFAYESLACVGLFVLFLLLVSRWRSRPRGSLLAAAIVCYSLVRIALDPFRGTGERSALGISENALVASVFLVVGAMAWVALARRARHGVATTV